MPPTDSQADEVRNTDDGGDVATPNEFLGGANAKGDVVDAAHRCRRGKVRGPHRRRPTAQSIVTDLGTFGPTDETDSGVTE